MIGTTRRLEISGDYRPAEEDKPEGQAALEFLRIDAEVVQAKDRPTAGQPRKAARAVHGNATRRTPWACRAICRRKPVTKTVTRS